MHLRNAVETVPAGASSRLKRPWSVEAVSEPMVNS
jgi:hypothetical protein